MAKLTALGALLYAATADASTSSAPQHSNLQPAAPHTENSLTPSRPAAKRSACAQLSRSHSLSHSHTHTKFGFLHVGLINR